MNEIKVDDLLEVKHEIILASSVASTAKTTFNGTLYASISELVVEFIEEAIKTLAKDGVISVPKAINIFKWVQVGKLTISFLGKLVKFIKDRKNRVINHA